MKLTNANLDTAKGSFTPTFPCNDGCFDFDKP